MFIRHMEVKYVIFKTFFKPETLSGATFGFKDVVGRIRISHMILSRNITLLTQKFFFLFDIYYLLTYMCIYLQCDSKLVTLQYP